MLKLYEMRFVDFDNDIYFLIAARDEQDARIVLKKRLELGYAINIEDFDKSIEDIVAETVFVNWYPFNVALFLAYNVGG